MFPIVGAFVLGAVLMGRTKPKTKISKKLLLGPRSGVSYTVEDFEDAGFLVVLAPDGSRGVFKRMRNVPVGLCALSWHEGTGDPTTLHSMFEDICGPRPTVEKDTQ